MSFRQVLADARELGPARLPGPARFKPPAEPCSEETAAVPRGRGRLEGAAGADDAGGREPFDPLDPATRHTAQLDPRPDLLGADAQPLALGAPIRDEVLPRARVSMEELLPQLVRRVAWAGDRRSGTVQLELGAGRYEGTVVTVHAADGRVRVELHGAGDVGALRERIDERLRACGIAVDG